MNWLRQRSTVLLILLASFNNAWLYPCRAVEIPPTGMKIPAMVAENSISTYVPSESAPGKGLAVNIICPKKPRYKEGAPVVVVVPDDANGLDFCTHAAQSGFIEIRFAFPGNGNADFASSGVSDALGPKSQEALRDVLLFAYGKLRDSQGRTISNLAPVKVYNSTVGMIGWSNGGNIAAVTLAKFADVVGFVGWIVFYETPMGSLFYPPNLGGIDDLFINRHYRDGSCATGECLVDYRKLYWQPDGQKLLGMRKKLGLPIVKGVLFFDENGNKRWEESFEYALSYVTDAAAKKQIYPPDVTRAAERFSIFKTDDKNKDSKDNKKNKDRDANGWPKTVATLAESEAFFKERDGSLYIQDICQKLPKLMITVFGSKVDHLQCQPDHPHIALQYNAWLANKAKWARLNPNSLYIGQVAWMNANNFINNKINESIDASAIDDYLEPKGLIPDYVFIEASISEMSDRKKTGKLFDELPAPLVIYTNDAKPDVSKPTTAKPGIF